MKIAHKTNCVAKKTVVGKKKHGTGLQSKLHKKRIVLQIKLLLYGKPGNGIAKKMAQNEWGIADKNAQNEWDCR